MKITVFGANGAIGRLFSQQALAQGHSLSLYSRSRSGLFESEHSSVFTGELSDYNAVRNAVRGADAVVSFLGPVLKYSYPGMPISDGHQNIIKAMGKEGIKRFITIGTPAISFEKDRAAMATVLPKFMARLFLPKPYKEITSVGRLVASSDLDWTIVRFIAPIDGSPKGHTKVSFGDKGIKFKITRADIAAFVLEEVAARRYVKSMPIIGS